MPGDFTPEQRAAISRNRGQHDPEIRKLKSEDGTAAYKKRKQTVESAFGIIKSAMGFRRFHLRGLARVATEWTLIALTYNCRRIARLQIA